MGRGLLSRAGMRPTLAGRATAICSSSSHASGAAGGKSAVGRSGPSRPTSALPPVLVPPCLYARGGGGLSYKLRITPSQKYPSARLRRPHGAWDIWLWYALS